MEEQTSAEAVGGRLCSAVGGEGGTMKGAGRAEEVSSSASRTSSGSSREASGSSKRERTYD